MFEEEALAWEEKLNRIIALFDVWIDVQRRWVYLEGIFSGSADIKTLLPIETSRFHNIRSDRLHSNYYIFAFFESFQEMMPIWWRTCF